VWALQRNSRTVAQQDIDAPVDAITDGRDVGFAVLVPIGDHDAARRSAGGFDRECAGGLECVPSPLPRYLVKAALPPRAAITAARSGIPSPLRSATATASGRRDVERKSDVCYIEIVQAWTRTVVRMSAPAEGWEPGKSNDGAGEPTSRIVNRPKLRNHGALKAF
jgi:hypothetical protein